MPQRATQVGEQQRPHLAGSGRLDDRMADRDDCGEGLWRLSTARAGAVVTRPPADFEGPIPSWEANDVRAGRPEFLALVRQHADTHLDERIRRKTERVACALKQLPLRGLAARLRAP